MTWLDPTGERRWGRGARSRPRSGPRVALVLLLALLLPACAPGPALERPGFLSGAPRARFEVGRDTFAFPNLVRAEHPTEAVPFANYCIIMARAANQFFRFARFAPEAAPLSDAEYARLAGEVMRIGPWEPPRPLEQRVVIPGYPDLQAFSRARETAIKAVFGSNVLSMAHWRTWRVAFPLSAGHQTRLAGELRAELDAGRPVPLMITNFPDPDLLNHAVLVYDHRSSAGGVEFLAYDPNDPANPLSLHFDPATRGFWVGPLPYSPPGRVRAFRLYASPLL